MSTEIPVIVCAADNRYAMPLAVMLRSLSDNLRSYPSAEVYVLDGGISAWNRRKVLKSIGRPNERPDPRLDVGPSLVEGRGAPSSGGPAKLAIHWICPPCDRLDSMPVFGHVSICTYYRLLLGELLPASLEQVIYLDLDLVVQADIGELWARPLGNSIVLAVEEPHGDSSEAVAHRASLGMQEGSDYFNAGVLSINLDAWRKEKIGPRVIEFVNAHRDVIKFWDQDGLNAVLENRWGKLESCWNCRVDPKEPDGILNGNPREAKIVHYASAVKPWDYYAKHPDIGMFYEYLDRTQWAGWRPQKPWRATIANKHWYGMWARRIPMLGRAWAALAERRKTLS